MSDIENVSSKEVQPGAGQESPETATERVTAESNGNEIAPVPELDEMRAQLEVAQSRIETMLMREVEHFAKERLAVASDIFDLGKHQISDLLDDAGYVSEEKTTEAIDALLKSRPMLAVNPPFWGDVGGGQRASYDHDTPDWKSALRGSSY
ncbi:hypothetical protein [Streptomyces paludis]|uniref:Uncharacterized protein n=1 Tax=Streptomyces paludis TaxID=2282738 RepID=A0A345HUS7_9ACTN|nr:hypothetical protein [Streptomyces paludis]AXG80451.1 hypothetical protein DVK44_25390 [Streptomyces paludis]